jgi:hypothetical protein
VATDGKRTQARGGGGGHGEEEDVSAREEAEVVGGRALCTGPSPQI